MIRVVACGALATVQDRGRPGALRWGVGTAGAMDGLALAAGNLLLGNAEDAAAVEVQVFPAAFRFEEAATFAVTGADCGATLDGAPLLAWTAAQAKAGAVLRLARLLAVAAALLGGFGAALLPVWPGFAACLLGALLANWAMDVAQAAAEAIGGQSALDAMRGEAGEAER